MYKFFISILIVLNSLLLAKYEDSTPERTTHQDLEILQDFKKLMYNKTKFNHKECNQEEIIEFIYINKIEEFDYNKLLIKINGQINNNENLSDEDGTYRDRDRASIQLAATYPIFDKKTDNEINKKKLSYKNTLIEEVEKYCNSKNKIQIINHEIDLLNLKQIRAKTREDTGQIYLDDRIILIEEIIKKKNELSTTTIEFQSMKLKLINKVKESSIIHLKELL
jgi:hypothetical protein